MSCPPFGSLARMGNKANPGQGQGADVIIGISLRPAQIVVSNRVCACSRVFQVIPSLPNSCFLQHGPWPIPNHNPQPPQSGPNMEGSRMPCEQYILNIPFQEHPSQSSNRSIICQVCWHENIIPCPTQAPGLGWLGPQIQGLPLTHLRFLNMILRKPRKESRWQLHLFLGDCPRPSSTQVLIYGSDEKVIMA